MSYTNYKWQKGQANWHIEHNALCDKLQQDIPAIQSEIKEARGGHPSRHARHDAHEMRTSQIEAFLEENSTFDPQDPNDMDFLASWIREVMQHVCVNGKELWKFRNVIFQTGQVSFSAVDGWFRTDYQRIELPNTFVNSDYIVLCHITEGDPTEAGQVKIYDKANNGFKLTITGSGAATVKWLAIKLDA